MLSVTLTLTPTLTLTLAATSTSVSVFGTAFIVKGVSPPSWKAKGTQLLTYGDPSGIVSSSDAKLTELSCSGQQPEWLRVPRVSGGEKAVRASIPASEFLLGANVDQRRQTDEGVATAAPQRCRVFAKETRKAQAKLLLLPLLTLPLPLLNLILPP